MRKHERQIVEKLKAADFDVLTITKHRQHTRIKLRRNGVLYTATVAGSPRDHDHAIRNTLRQALKGTTP